MYDIVEKFWSKVQKSDGCWEWLGAKSRKYGQSYDGVRSTGAHRFSWILHKGEIPEGKWVLHKCNNPSCVNPDHLYLGTRADNIGDMLEADRQVKVQPLHRKFFGGEVWLVRKLLRAGFTHELIGRMFKVSETTIHCIKVNPNFLVKELRSVS